MAGNIAVQDQHGVLALSDTVKAVVRSACLHARTLEAELKYLDDVDLAGTATGKLAELESVLAALSEQMTPQPPVPPAEKGQILPKPMSFQVNELYLGPDHQHLVANAGDTVTVHARFSRYAIAWNPRNDTTGQILDSHLDPIGTELAGPHEIALLRENSGIPLIGGLQWQKGDRIRVCKWTSTFRNEGIAVNLRTAKIGRFQCPFNSIKVVENTVRDEKVG